MSARNLVDGEKCRSCSDWKELEHRVEKNDEQTQVKLNKLRVRQVESDREMVKLKSTIDSMNRYISQLGMMFQSEAARQQNGHLMYPSNVMGNSSGVPMNWYVPQDFRSVNNSYGNDGSAAFHGGRPQQLGMECFANPTIPNARGNTPSVPIVPNVDVNESGSRNSGNIAHMNHPTHVNPTVHASTPINTATRPGAMQRPVQTSSIPIGATGNNRIPGSRPNSTREARPIDNGHAQSAPVNHPAPKKGQNGQKSSVRPAGTAPTNKRGSGPIASTSTAPNERRGIASENSSLNNASESWADENVSDAELVCIVDSIASTKPPTGQKGGKPASKPMNRLNILKEAMRDANMTNNSAKTTAKQSSRDNSNTGDGKKGEKRVMGSSDDSDDEGDPDDSYAGVASRDNEKWLDPPNKRRRQSGKSKNVLEGGNSAAMSDIFVSNLSYTKCKKPEDLEKLVKLHCKSKGVNIGFARTYLMRYDEESANCKVSVRAYDEEKVLSYDFWPAHVSARLWIPSELYNQKADKGIDKGNVGI